MDFKGFVESQKWTFAKTYAKKCPHEYLMKGHLERGLRDTFIDAITLIRESGFEAFYYRRAGMYYICGDHYYWTMGASIESTTVLNRALLADYDRINNRWVWKGLNENIS